MKYSLNQLNQVKRDVSRFITSNDKLDRNLTFLLRTNLKKIDEATELVKEDFEELTDEEKERLQTFQQEKMEVIREHDGELEQTPQGTQIKNYQELAADEAFNEAIQQLADEHRDILDRVDEIEDHNRDIASDKIANIDWREISLNKFPEDLDDSFTNSFLEFTIMEED